MKKKKNTVWKFFSSVKLALFLLFILAVCSIIGTIIPQNNPPAFYVQEYGKSLPMFFTLLDVPDMYNSWWFLSLLVVLSLNLVICSLDRFPNAWRLITMDNLAIAPERLRRTGYRKNIITAAPFEKVTAIAAGIMTGAGWRPKQAAVGEGTLLFAQKGAWTRLGVYGVHCSILVIFVGAIIGSLYGYKASVMLPELSSTDVVYASARGHAAIPLGFTLRCDRFELSYYDNGAPKEYRSDLAVVQDGKEVYSKSIVVNDPMQYGGLTFYQSSYDSMKNELVAVIENNKTKAKKRFAVSPRREVQWPAAGLSFGVVDMDGPDRMGRYRLKIWFSDGKAAPAEFWTYPGVPAEIERPATTYSFSIRQRFATGLQVAKDPGVWYVYIGCIMMLLGLAVAFFLSHKRIWIYVSRGEGENANLLISGSSNKNKAGFEKKLEELIEKFQNNTEIIKE